MRFDFCIWKKKNDKITANIGPVRKSMVFSSSLNLHSIVQVEKKLQVSLLVGEKERKRERQTDCDQR